MNRIAHLVFVSAAILGDSHAHAQIAGFDCSGTHGPTEETICQTPALGAQDIRMATYYQILQDAHTAQEGMAYREFRDGLRDEQATWQRQSRDTCGANTACLSDAYRNRIAALRELTQKTLVWTPNPATSATDTSVDAGNATYTIEGDPVTLVNGKSERPAAPGSAAMHVTTLTGPTASGQLDGHASTAVFLSDASGGSGTFFYVAVAQESGHGTSAILLGDRLEPQSISIEHKRIVVRYLDRPQQAPMYVKPSVVVVRRFTLSGGRLSKSQ